MIYEIVNEDDDDEDGDEDGRRIIPIALGLSAGGLKNVWIRHRKKLNCLLSRIFLALISSVAF